ncbi:MAG: Rossmann-like and DUF2520 domain-containing protein [Flavobacteriaceae bacterium]
MKVAVLGSGNVAIQLLSVFKKQPQIIISQWYSRSPLTPPKELNEIEIIHQLEQLVPSDVYLLALTDTALSSLSNYFQNKEFVVHMAGAHGLDILQNKGPKGVWYPVQSFTQERLLTLEGLPFSIEGSTTNATQQLEKLTKLVGGKPIKMDTKQRLALHLAAVLCNNFTNHLYTQTAALCESYKIDFELLLPLIEETTARLHAGRPADFQTGPARRGDQLTLNKHLPLMPPQLKKLYLHLTKTIEEYYGKQKL